MSLQVQPGSGCWHKPHLSSGQTKLWGQAVRCEVYQWILLRIFHVATASLRGSEMVFLLEHQRNIWIKDNYFSFLCLVVRCRSKPGPEPTAALPAVLDALGLAVIHGKHIKKIITEEVREKYRAEHTQTMNFKSFHCLLISLKIYVHAGTQAAGTNVSWCLSLFHCMFACSSL